MTMRSSGSEERVGCRVAIDVKLPRKPHDRKRSALNPRAGAHLVVFTSCRAETPQMLRCVLAEFAETANIHACQRIGRKSRPTAGRAPGLGGRVEEDVGAIRGGAVAFVFRFRGYIPPRNKCVPALHWMGNAERTQKPLNGKSAVLRWN